MKVKVKDISQTGDKVTISVEVGKGQNKQTFNYQYSKTTELNLDRIKADIKKDVMRKEKLEARVGELKNLIGKDIDL